MTFIQTLFSKLETPETGMSRRVLRQRKRFAWNLSVGSDLIRETPDTWPRYLHGTRRFILTGFPYSLVYTTDGSYSLIIAIAHAKRAPGYWKVRLTGPGG